MLLADSGQQRLLIWALLASSFGTVLVLLWKGLVSRQGSRHICAPCASRLSLSLVTTSWEWIQYASLGALQAVVQRLGLRRVHPDTSTNNYSIKELLWLRLQLPETGRPLDMMSQLELQGGLVHAYF